MAEKKIGGRLFRTDRMLATAAIKLQARLVKVAGTMLDQLPVIMRGAGAADPDLKAASDAAAIKAMTSVFEKTDPDTIVSLFVDIVGVSEIKRPNDMWSPVDLDADMSDDQGNIIPLVVWILQEQFGAFFTGILANGRQKT